nr:unnamed protein product [Spirometra erinaceieuropaei]
MIILKRAFEDKCEKTSLQETINGLVFYRRYMDDIFCLTDGTTDTEELVQKFNNAHPSLEFTAETEADNELAFLDVLLHRQEGQAGRRLSPRILVHKRAVRGGDPLSHVATHTLEESHEFDFANTQILARAGNKTGRELLEAWVSDGNFINRHFDLPAGYHALRPRGQVTQLTSPRSTKAVTMPGDHCGPGSRNQT